MDKDEQVAIEQIDRDAASTLWKCEGTGFHMSEVWPEAFARHRTRALEASQAVDNAEKLRRIDDFMLEEIFMDQSEQPWRADDFKGDNAHLIDCIDAFLDLNDDHAMTPTNLSKGHHAYRLLCAARHRLATPPQAAESGLSEEALEIIRLYHGFATGKDTLNPALGPKFKGRVEALLAKAGKPGEAGNG